jgi:hypothetical protein
MVVVVVVVVMRESAGSRDSGCILPIEWRRFDSLNHHL